MRKRFFSVSMLALMAAGVFAVTDRAAAQIFIGTPTPQQFLGQGQPSTQKGEWFTNGADKNFSRYVPLDQINGSNFNRLQVAWRFKTDHFGPYPEYKLEGTPLMVKGVLYTTAGTRRAVIALDAKTGELLWTHSIDEGHRAAVSARQLSGRGVSYWTDGRGDERIIYVTTGYRLVELNAKTGQMITSFGDGGARRPQARRGERRERTDRPRLRRNRHSRAADGGRRRAAGRLLDARGRDRAHAQQHQGRGARLRCAHRQAAVAVQHHSGAGRTGQRDVGKQFLGRQRQHRRVDAHHRRRGARPRLSSGGDADFRLLRRPPPGQ